MRCVVLISIEIHHKDLDLILKTTKIFIFLMNPSAEKVVFEFNNESKYRH